MRRSPMSFAIVQPAALAAAASHLTGVGYVLAARNMVAEAATTRLLPAAADEVSALAAIQFNAHAAMYQAAGAQAITIHQQFVAILGCSGDSYAATEAMNTAATR
jgi:PE family